MRNHFLNGFNQEAQNAREKRPRQSDVMPDIKNMDVKLGCSPKHELESNIDKGNNEVDLEAGDDPK